MLIDTTVWIDFFKGKSTKQVSVLEKAILNNDEVFICGVILTEILQGIEDTRKYAQVKSSLESLIYLDLHYETYLFAADIYRKLRKKGLTVRKTIDCLIASVAIEYGLPLLHNDKDFLPIQQHCGLKRAE